MNLINQIYTEFKIDLIERDGGLRGPAELEPSAFPEFCKDTCFNYFSSPSGSGEIAPKFRDSRVLYLNNVSKIYTLELKSALISYWGDVWLNKDHKVIDPKIFRLNLQNNRLEVFSIEEERSELRYLDLSGNRELTDIYAPLTPKLQSIKLNRLTNINSVVVNSGSVPTISRVEMKQCNISPGVISSIPFSIEQGILDIRGSELSLNEDDNETLEFLEIYGYTILR